MLLYIYKCKTEGKEIPNPEQLLNETGWSDVRLNNALQYLVENEFIDADILTCQDSTKVEDVYIKDITSLGINIIEDGPEFKNHFGITLNLGVLQFLSFLFKLLISSAIEFLIFLAIKTVNRPTKEIRRPISEKACLNSKVALASNENFTRAPIIAVKIMKALKYIDCISWPS